MPATVVLDWPCVKLSEDHRGWINRRTQLAYYSVLKHNRVWMFLDSRWFWSNLQTNDWNIMEFKFPWLFNLSKASDIRQHRPKTAAPCRAKAARWIGSAPGRAAEGFMCRADRPPGAPSSSGSLWPSKVGHGHHGNEHRASPGHWQLKMTTMRSQSPSQKVGFNMA